MTDSKLILVTDQPIFSIF